CAGWLAWQKQKKTETRAAAAAPLHSPRRRRGGRRRRLGNARASFPRAPVRAWREPVVVDLGLRTRGTRHPRRDRGRRQFVFGCVRGLSRSRRGPLGSFRSEE